MRSQVKKKLKEFNLSLKMKKIYFLISFLFALNYICVAQQNEKFGDRIEALKVAFMTKELNLSATEAQQFWPVYNTYFQELKQARLDYPNDVIAYEEKVVSIRKKYREDFKKILGTDERVNQVFMSERNFREMLRKEIQNRQQFRKNNPPPQGP
jgi:hypothetical protein